MIILCAYTHNHTYIYHIGVVRHLCSLYLLIKVVLLHMHLLWTLTDGNRISFSCGKINSSNNHCYHYCHYFTIIYAVLFVVVMATILRKRIKIIRMIHTHHVFTHFIIRNFTHILRIILYIRFLYAMINFHRKE